MVSPSPRDWTERTKTQMEESIAAGGVGAVYAGYTRDFRMPVVNMILNTPGVDKEDLLNAMMVVVCRTIGATFFSLGSPSITDEQIDEIIESVSESLPGFLRRELEMGRSEDADISIIAAGN